MLLNYDISLFISTVFVMQMISLYRDPIGEHVFSKTVLTEDRTANRIPKQVYIFVGLRCYY